jgi:hypothetical protein
LMTERDPSSGARRASNCERHAEGLVREQGAGRGSSIRTGR